MRRDDWATPQDLFDRLDAEFHFDLDPCADDENHKCAEYFTKEQDGLSKNWGGRRVFCNPPYGKNVGRWVKKAWEESQKQDTLVVMLLPASTDTRWFHDYILHRTEVRPVKGRIAFGDGVQKAPFASMVVVFRAPGVR